MKKEFLRYLYLNKSLSVKQISEKYPYSINRINYILGKHNIKKSITGHPHINIEGEKYNRLLCLYFHSARKDRREINRFYYMFLCDCGNKKVISGVKVKAGLTKSCGCIQAKDWQVVCENKIYGSYKKRAKTISKKFSITKNEFIKLILSNCSYCGIAHSNGIKIRNKIFEYNGVDRVDNNLGYETNNLVTCCKQCNKAKGILSRKDFIKWIKSVAIYI